MTKDRIIYICDKAIEIGFYIILVAVAFSNSIVEIAATAIIFVWLLRLMISREFGRLNILPAKILLLYFIWVLLSCFNSDYPKESFRGVFKALEYSLLFLVTAATPWGRSAIKRFINVLSVSVIAICLNGGYQYFFGRGLIRGRALMKDDYLRRISSSFVHPNDFGVYLLVASLIFISFLFIKRERVWEKVVTVVCVLISMCALYLTKSRGAWLSFVSGFLAFGALKAKRVLALFVVLLMLMVVFLPHSVRDRMSDIMDFKSGTSWERLMLWKGTVKMVKVHPVLGFGVNTYSRNFPKYKPADYWDVRYSHNCYLHMASEIGIPGALLFVWFIMSVLVSAGMKVFKKMEPDRKALVSGLVAGLVGFAINSSVDTHLYSLTLAVFFHILMGFCYSLSMNGEELETA